MIIEMILFSAVAGICGMGLGGLISAVLLKKPSATMTCWLLSFAAGVMTSIVCFGLIPETFEIAGVVITLAGLLLGIVVIMVLNRIVDRITETREENLKVHHTPEELYHGSQFIHERTKMLRSGILMLIAIGLHNVPEGIAIGAAGSHSFQLGALLAIMIALHNIPEGMAIAAPLLAGGVNRWRVVFLTALCGATTLIGGLIGILIGSISDTAVALSLSAAGGAMLYIVFGEIIPQSIVMTKNRTATIVTLFGIIVGLIATQM
ncbi:MAG: ZIP family metal transporter [Spirochaetes bacterium]|nr:ZIP family metal transporter [Spirochaetota bacterium]